MQTKSFRIILVAHLDIHLGILEPVYNLVGNHQHDQVDMQFEHILHSRYDDLKRCE